MTDRVIVRTGEDQSLAELAGALIALADDPHHVVWEHRAGYLTVPEYVAARYADGMTAVDTEPVSDVEAATDVVEVDVTETPAKRKPGRPRKAAAVTEEVN